MQVILDTTSKIPDMQAQGKVFLLPGHQAGSLVTCLLN
jgi:hypothetical protein